MPSVPSDELLVVDGYNVIFKSPRYMARVDESGGGDPFDQARDLLAADVAAYARGRFDPVIVFDAAGNVSDERPERSTAGVRTVFSRRGETADTVIERLVTQARLTPKAVTVITSDRAIRATVGGIPVTRVSSDVLVADVGIMVGEVERTQEEQRHSKMTVADRIDPAMRAKLDAIRGRG